MTTPKSAVSDAGSHAVGAATASPDNPGALLQPWTTPHGVPPFGAFAPADFSPAFAAALTEHKAEIAAIAGDPEPANFDNVIAAMERAGAKLTRVSNLFFNLSSADTSPEIQAIEREMAPVLARHYNAIALDPALFARVLAVPEAGLTPEQARLLEREKTGFRRAGAGLPPETMARLSDIAARLATLGASFAQNVLADESAWEMALDEADLAGLPDDLRNAAAQAANERGQPGRYVITLSRSLLEPFLQFSTRRDLRERAFRAFAARGANGDAHDNRAIIAETMALRAEKARLLGYDSFAAFRLDDSMAKTPDAVAKLLQSVWKPARARALADQQGLQELFIADGHNGELEPWDWRHYAARRRQSESDFDETRLKPYLQLDRMIAAAFDVARRLFGLTFRERADLPRWRDDVRAFEVTDRNDRLVAVFYGDYFNRPSKRSGAWMSSFRSQQNLDGEVRPVVVNVMNFARPADGQPALLSFDDARTLFHEFGHALHGMLSNVTYPSLAGTSVARDFVEFPSQLYEHWLEQPEVLQAFATHWRTVEPMPEPMLRRLLDGRNEGQGFATVEYAASALVDLRLHQQTDFEGFDIDAFERATLDDIGMPRAIIMRHRPGHFLHVFAGDGYSSAYYSYLWSEVLDADGFAAFRDSGDIFNPELARRLRDFVYAAGNLRDPREAWLGFRGREADPQALLAKRGLDQAA
ncbi:M3 family metallopeptidase [Camelimonas sp. ID_303_24]